MACFSALCKLLSLPQGSSARKMGSRTRLFFLPGSGAVFSSSQTRPWLVFRCYVNFFLSRSGPAREKWALGPDFSHFSGLAHGKWAPRPGFSSFPSPALVFRHYVNLFSRATHYNVPNEYPCVCAASIRSPSTAAFVADSACSR